MAGTYDCFLLFFELEVQLCGREWAWMTDWHTCAFCAGGVAAGHGGAEWRDKVVGVLSLDNGAVG